MASLPQPAEGQMKTSLASLLLLAVVGCYGTDYTVHPDTGFPPDLLDAAHAAAADWESKVPVKFAFSSTSCATARPAGLVCLHVVATLPQVPWQPGELAGFTVLDDIWLAGP